MPRRIIHHARRVHRHINSHALFWVIFLSISGVIALQLLYPQDRAVPFARLNGKLVGYQKFDTVAERVNGYFLDSRVTLQASDTAKVTFAPREAGAEVDLDNMSYRLTNYPIWLRLIPLSFIFLQPDVKEIDLTFNARQQQVFITGILPKLNTPPQNAALEIKDGALIATNDVAGTEVIARDVTSVLSSSKYSLQATTLTVPAKRLSPDKSRAYFDSVRQQAETIIAWHVVITADDKTFTPTSSQIAQWLAIGEDEAGKAKLVVNDKGLDEYLAYITKETADAAGVTSVTRIDGRETSRTEGQSGRAINTAKLKSEIAEAIATTTNQRFVAEFVTVPALVVINQKYSSSQAGLQAYLDDLSAVRNVRVSVQQLGSNGWAAGTRVSESTVSASTYKLFVALVLFDKMDRGEITWDTPILDTNTRGCFERMIVASTNTCAEEWIRQFGRTGINQFIWNKGFSHATDFNNPEANHTSAADLTRYFKGLHEGWLMSGWARDYLLDALQRHPYRKGIPSGSAGKVHNKVGFLWDYSNDSAVVYHPRGTYVIAVMTKGLSFYAIADITRESEAIMYP